MSSTREMPGIIDFTGATVNGLKIGHATRLRPAPVHETECSVCSSRSTANYTAIRAGSVRCKASGCGKPVIPSRAELIREQKRIAAEREAEAERAAVEAAAARMEAETDEYQRPERYAPEPSEPDNLTDRQRRSLREWREQQEAERRVADAPRLEVERRAAEEQAERERAEAERREKQTAYWREWVLNDRDPQLFVSEEMRAAEMPQSRADAFNAEQVQKFIAETPDYAEYKSPENADSITSYLIKNGVHIADAATFKAAFVRLRDLGILTKRPAPVPEPVPTPSRVNLRIAEEPKPASVDDGSETGIDWLTGKPLTLTKRQVDALSSTDYRRFKELDGEALSLRPLSPLFRGADEAS